MRMKMVDPLAPRNQLEKLKEALKKNPPKKTRLSRGTTSRVFYRKLNKAKRLLLTWAINLKPGDLFNSFDFLNHRVESVCVIWAPIARFGWAKRRANGEFVWDVIITSSDGYSHHVEDWFSIVPPWTTEEITSQLSKPMLNAMIALGIVSKENNVSLRPADDFDNNVLDQFRERKISL